MPGTLPRGGTGRGCFEVYGMFITDEIEQSAEFNLGPANIND